MHPLNLRLNAKALSHGTKPGAHVRSRRCQQSAIVKNVSEDKVENDDVTLV